MTEVLIPWKRTPERTANYYAVRRHLEACSFDPVCSTMSEPWSPGKARNHGATAFTGDIFVFNDADTICPPAQMFRAIELAEDAPGLVFAYDLYVRLSREETEIVQDEALDSGVEEWLAWPHERVIHNSGSMGCVAISRACFEEVGGFDESYVGWGYEDLDFATRCNALWPNRRVSGPMFHLWHGDRRSDDAPDDSDPDQVKANEARWQASTV